MAEFKVHAAAHIHQLEHRASPGGTGDGYLHRLRTELRVAGDESVAAAEQHSGVAVMHGLNFEDGRRWKIVEKNAAFDFRADDATVHIVRQVGMGVKHAQT